MLRTNGERLQTSLLEMAKIGATSAGGVTRLSLTEADREARDLFGTWARQGGLQVRVDDLGNQYARLQGMEPTAAPVMIGSHLDSVPAGGKFDGTFGVMAALEVVRTIRDADIRTRRPIEVVNFTNEEGARFEPAMMASGVLAGQFTTEYFYSREDREGHTLGAELERIGYRGSASNRPTAIHAYVEVHIEQGPVLEAEGLPLGLVEGILGIRWANVALLGQSDHAGGTPMRRRRDAVVAAGRVVSALRDLALDYGDPTVVTVGRLRAFPGVINQVSSQVEMSVDIRCPTDAQLTEIGERADRLVQSIAAEEKVNAVIDPFWRISPTIFNRRVLSVLEDALQSLGIPYRRMTSGPGHDAKYINEIAPAAMLFVRTLGGRSHCEAESISWADAQLAADVLLHAVLRLANEDGA